MHGDGEANSHLLAMSGNLALIKYLTLVIINIRYFNG